MNTQSIISPEDSEGFFKELGMANLPDDKKTNMLDTMIDTVMERIFLRIEPTLTDTDKQYLEDLEVRPNANQAMVEYLLSHVPNIDAIAKEEVQKYKEDLKKQITTIIDVIDKEASKPASV